MAVFVAGPQLRGSRGSVPRRTSTARVAAAVFPAGPQLPGSSGSVPRRTSNASLKRRTTNTQPQRKTQTHTTTNSNPKHTTTHTLIVEMRTDVNAVCHTPALEKNLRKQGLDLHNSKISKTSKAQRFQKLQNRETIDRQGRRNAKSLPTYLHLNSLKVEWDVAINIHKK